DESEIQVRAGPACGGSAGGLRGGRRASPPPAARATGDELPAGIGRLLLRVSDEAARVSGALQGLVPARRREPGRDDPAGVRALASGVELTWLERSRRWAEARAERRTAGPVRRC